MKLTLREAESDYVQFGNLRIPKDMSGMGFDDFQTAARKGQRAYDAEKEAERKAAEAKKKSEEEARVAAMRDADYDTFSNITINEHAPEDDLQACMSALFEEFVPGSGKCENLGRELIRAINRVGYRNYNDGDYFFSGYGLETCGPDMAFVYDHCDEDVQRAIEKAEELNQYMYDDDQMSDKYDERLNTIFEEVLRYIADNPDVFGTVTEDSRSYKSDIIDEWEEHSKSYEYEVDTYAAGEAVEKGWITWDEVLENVRGWVEYDIQQGEVNNYALDAITITDLDREHYQQCEEEIGRWMEQWMDEVYQEHEDEEDEYEDEEDYDEDEDYDEE